MLTKHFFKVLVLFAIMLAVGLVGIFLASHYSPENGETTAGVPPCQTGKIC